MNRYKKITEWLKGCPYSIDNQYIYFNAIPNEVDTTSVTSSSSDTAILKEYNNNNREVELYFNISLIKDYDKGTSDINLQAMEAFDKVDEWIRSQVKQNNFPDFGNDIVHDIEAAYTNPDVFVNEDESKCQLEARYRVTYMRV